MEAILALSIGALASSGVWLMLRTRTYQVLIGLSLLSYAVNLFIFSMGRVRTEAPPILKPGVPETLANYTDPLPQALVLTAIHHFRHDGAVSRRAPGCPRPDPQ